MHIHYVSVLVYLVVTIALALTIIGLSAIFGKKKITPAKMLPYECGMDPIGHARTRFSVRFYIIAMLFIIFDIEAAFFYPWAVVYRDLGLFGFVEMLVFIIVLLIGLVYLWKKGALEWE
nr:NADH-quinone oxidoreductase subunit A [Desulfobacterales bacterium]